MRWDLVDSRTGFLALGPYIKTDCGVDTTGNGEFPRMRDIYSMFREEVSLSLSAFHSTRRSSRQSPLVSLSLTLLPHCQFCPPTLQLSAWAGQFIVSRQRILANSLSKYETLLNSLQAPMHHWIHEEGAWFEYKGSVGPSNPFLGHALERSWPTIFSESRSFPPRGALFALLLAESLIVPLPREDCTDPRIADLCKDDTYDKENCQCFDD